MANQSHVQGAKGSNDSDGSGRRGSIPLESPKYQTQKNITKIKKMEEKLNLFQKIQAVSNEIRNIEKNMTVGSGSYAYKAVADIDVMMAVKDAETMYKLVSIPIKQELVKSEVVRTLKKDVESITYVDIVKMTVRIIDLEDHSQYIDIETFGRGLDPGDKGFGKASTYARKYAMLNAYKIATGEDPDKDKSVEQTTIKIDEKRDEVINYLMTDNSYMNNILAYFNLGSSDDLSDKQIHTIYTNLKKKGLI